MRTRVDDADHRTLNSDLGRVVWLTGLPASGKSTIANELKRHLVERGSRTCLLDGDSVRQRLCADLGFSPEDRRENIRRVSEVARLLADAGLICVVALISPYRSDRELARRNAGDHQFIEVYVNAPLEVCIQRDPKGLYAKARANQIQHFTGISAPYEPPLTPDIELKTDRISVAQAVTGILECLEQSGRKQTAPK